MVPVRRGKVCDVVLSRRHLLVSHSPALEEAGDAEIVGATKLQNAQDVIDLVSAAARRLEQRGTSTSRRMGRILPRLSRPTVRRLCTRFLVASRCVDVSQLHSHRRVSLQRPIPRTYDRPYLRSAVRPLDPHPVRYISSSTVVYVALRLAMRDLETYDAVQQMNHVNYAQLYFPDAVDLSRFRDPAVQRG